MVLTSPTGPVIPVIPVPGVPARVSGGVTLGGWPCIRREPGSGGFRYRIDPFFLPGLGETQRAPGSGNQKWCIVMHEHVPALKKKDKIHIFLFY